MRGNPRHYWPPVCHGCHYDVWQTCGKTLQSAKIANVYAACLMSHIQFCYRTRIIFDLKTGSVL